MTDIHDHRPDNVLLGFDVDQELAAKIRERLPNLPPDNWLGEQVEPRRAYYETPQERAIRETEEYLRDALEIDE